VSVRPVKPFNPGDWGMTSAKVRRKPSSLFAQEDRLNASPADKHKGRLI
jgi:hypothetical protein